MAKWCLTQYVKLNYNFFAGVRLPIDVQVTSTKEPDQGTVSSFIAWTMRDKHFNRRSMMFYLRKVNVSFPVLMIMIIIPSFGHSMGISWQ